MNRYISIILTLSLLLASASGLRAQDTRTQEARKARLEREIAIIDKQLAENSSKSNAMLSNLTLIRKKISNRKALVEESDRQIQEISDKIYLKQRQINRLQARVDTLTNHYSRLILSAYKNRDSRIWYMHILASENIAQAFRRYSYFKNLSTQMNKEAKEIRLMQEDLIGEKEALAAMKKEAQAVKAERVSELDKLRKEEAQADKVVKTLKKNRKTYQNQLNAKKKEVTALNREIERIVAAAMKSPSTTSKTRNRSLSIINWQRSSQRTKESFHGLRTVLWSVVSENSSILCSRILSFRLTMVWTWLWPRAPISRLYSRVS